MNKTVIKNFAITGEAIRQRERLAEVIRKKEAGSDYATAYSKRLITHTLPFHF